MGEHSRRLGGPDDPRTIEELFRDALIKAGDDVPEDEDIAYTAIGALHFRGGRDVFECACKLCVSKKEHFLQMIRFSIPPFL